MIFSNREPANLDEWLETATKGIAAAGRERITREIGAHFEAAVEAHLANGEARDTAKAGALQQLGDAKSARRSFRKQHLTKLEERRVSGLRKWFGDGSSLFVILFGLYFTLEVSIHRPKHYQLSLALIWIALIVVPILLFIVTRRHGYELKPLSLPTLLSLQSFQFVTLGFCWALISFEESVPVAGWLAILSLVAITVVSFQTWKKIRKNENRAAERSGPA